MRYCNVVFFLLNLLILWISTGAYASDFSLNGFKLRRAAGADLGRYYDCASRVELNGTFHCIVRNPEAGTDTRPESLLLAPNGAVLFAQKNDWFSGNHADVARTVVPLISQRQGGGPRTFTEDFGVFIAAWGDARLEEIASHATEYHEIDDVVEGRYGALLVPGDSVEDAKSSWKPMYRVGGGDGLVVVVSDYGDGEVLVQRLVVAGGTLAEENFRYQAEQFLSADRLNVKDDVSNWYDVAFMIRRLALNTSPARANMLVDETFGRTEETKYYSHVWAFIPTSVLNHLKTLTYTAVDVFGENTEFPEIRSQMIQQLDTDPNEPFSEFLLYSLGRFDEAVRVDPKSPIQTVLLYAQAHSRMRALMAEIFGEISKGRDADVLDESIVDYSFREDEYFFEPYQEQTPRDIDEKLSQRNFFRGSAYEMIPLSKDEYNDAKPTVTQLLNYINKFPERHGSVPLVNVIPRFREITEETLTDFAQVLRDQSSRHFDDAYYYLAWLTYHRGDLTEALNMFGDLIAYRRAGTSDGDYRPDDYIDMALIQMNRIFRTLPPEDVLERIRNNNALSRQSDIWFTALRLFYQSHQYSMVMTGAQEALDRFGLGIDSLSVTTDAARLSDEIWGFELAGDGGLVNVGNLSEIAYLHRASREIRRMEERLRAIRNRPDPDIEEDLRELVLKYALVSDVTLQAMNSGESPGPHHRDIRQSLYLLRTALDLMPSTSELADFREWLHYKRIRLLAEFDPVRVGAANRDFQNEFPNSDLLDDGLAEQVFAEAVIIGDMARAERTFGEIRLRHPNANAIDNAHSWMAIGWTCLGQPEKAREVDMTIIDQFPRTRHAQYALERLQDPQNCLRLDYMWDYRAMQWREKNRIDEIQIASGSRMLPELENADGPDTASRSSAKASALLGANAVEFVSKVLALHSMPGRQGLAEMSNVYADKVNYFGKMTDVSEVMNDKENYFDRWPIRAYDLIANSVQTDCSGGQFCSVSGYFEWIAESIERERKAAGTAYFEFSVSADPPHRIEKENSRVVSRR